MTNPVLERLQVAVEFPIADVHQVLLELLGLPLDELGTDVDDSSLSRARCPVTAGHRSLDRQVSRPGVRQSPGRTGSTARTGATIENPVTGERIEFRESATDPDVDGVAFDYYLAPEDFAVGKLDHVHPNQEERFEVRAGRLGVRVDGDEWTATPGTRFAVLPETSHTVWNDGDEEMHALVEVRPALDVESFFETMFGLARDGATNGWGVPGPLQLAVVGHTYRREFSLVAVPEPLQRGLAALATPVGRIAGHRGRYERYDPAA